MQNELENSSDRLVMSDLSTRDRLILWFKAITGRSRRKQLTSHHITSTSRHHIASTSHQLHINFTSSHYINFTSHRNSSQQKEHLQPTRVNYNHREKFVPAVWWLRTQAHSWLRRDIKTALASWTKFRSIRKFRKSFKLRRILFLIWVE